jgi:hypothetical protein
MVLSDRMYARNHTVSKADCGTIGGHSLNAFSLTRDLLLLGALLALLLKMGAGAG